MKPMNNHHEATLDHNFYGQHHIIQQIQQRWKKRLPHALLLQGLKGTGKATFAYHLTHALLQQSLNSLTKIAAHDPLYNRLKNHSHTDVLFLQRTSDDQGKFSRDITVNESRQIHKFLSKTAFEGQWRIIIIDSIDDMNRQAINAILKGLEEPPAHCLFILINHQPGHLPATIASRCQPLLFMPLQRHDLNSIVESWPASACKSNISTESFMIPDIAYDYAEGSAYRAQQFINHDGENLYGELQNVINDLAQDSWSTAFNFTKDVITDTKNNDYERFNFISDIINFYFKKRIEFILEPSKLLGSSLYKSSSHLTLSQLVDLWSNIKTILQESLTLNLDPMQTFINIFTYFTPQQKNNIHYSF